MDDQLPIDRRTKASEDGRSSFSELPAGREVRLFDAGSTMTEGEIAFSVQSGGKLTLLEESGKKRPFPSSGRIARVEVLAREEWSQIWNGKTIAPPKADSTFCKVLYVADDVPLSSSTYNIFWIEVLAEN